MNATVHALLIFVHLLGMLIWIGGMVFAHACLRPEAARLDPPVRLPLLAGVLGRFFGLVMLALVLIWVSGAGLLMGGSSFPRLGLHAMIGLAAVMTVIYLVIRFRWYRQMTGALAAGDLPAAGRAMGAIRQWVGINLVLGLLVVVAGTLGRAL